jgi:RNA-binding protein
MRSRQRLGTVLHVSSSSGNLILKADGSVKIGDVVVDGRGKKIGSVFDLFGPVSAPFVAVRPRVESPEKCVGEPLFVGRS